MCKILAIVLFGSYARGETDVFSDKDICVIVTELNTSVLEEIRSNIAKEYSVNADDITIYSHEQIELMQEYGSLFLWHLKLEGKAVYGYKYFKKMTNNLSVYEKHSEEIYFHQELLRDVMESIGKYSYPNELDLSVLFTICRNVCMILAHKMDNLAFGRSSVYDAAASSCDDMPLNRELYDYLAGWKLIYERGQKIDVELPSIIKIQGISAEVKKLVDYATEKVRNS